MIVKLVLYTFNRLTTVTLPCFYRTGFLESMVEPWLWSAVGINTLQGIVITVSLVRK